MPQSNHYMLRRSPMPLGATSDDFKDFDELITRSNDMQLYAYIEHIKAVLKRREL